jgi:hypothetical protein
MEVQESIQKMQPMVWRGKILSGFGFRVSGFGFQVSDFGFRFSGFGFWVSIFGLRVCSFGFEVCDLGHGFELRVWHSSRKGNFEKSRSGIRNWMQVQIFENFQVALHARTFEPQSNSTSNIFTTCGDKCALHGSKNGDGSKNPLSSG